MPKVTQESVCDQRKSFEDERDVTRAEIRTNAAVLSRQLLQRMSSGEPYDIDDFIFAASLGQPKDYKNEAKTLRTIAGLSGGEFVGVVEDKQIVAAGITSKEPLILETRIHPYPQDPEKELRGRMLFASIGIIMGVVKTRLNDRHVIEDGSLPVLKSSMNEGGYSRFEAFWHTGEVIVGTSTVIEHASRQDDLFGLRTVGNILDRLARSAYDGHQVTET